MSFNNANRRFHEQVDRRSPHQREHGGGDVGDAYDSAIRGLLGLGASIRRRMIAAPRNVAADINRMAAG